MRAKRVGRGRGGWGGVSGEEGEAALWRRGDEGSLVTSDGGGEEEEVEVGGVGRPSMAGD